MQFCQSLVQLIEALRCLPSVGNKSAQRMAIHLLEKNPEGAKRLASSLVSALDNIQRCDACRMLSDQSTCSVCANDKRRNGELCVVESVMDLIAIEQSGGFEGQYFVLHGRLSPLDGIGPTELQLHDLEQLLKEHDDITSLILAISPTIEGEATSNYLIGLARQYGKAVAKIAYGVPFGGELEYVDGHTLSHAFASRQVV